MHCKTVEVVTGPNKDVRLPLKVYSPSGRLPAFVPVVVAVHDLGMSGDVFAPLEPLLATADPSNADERLRAMMSRRRHPMSRSPNAPPCYIEEMYLVTYDQRGHGSAVMDTAADRPIDVNSLVDDCARVLDHVQANLFHNHQIFVLAHGVGSAVALSALSRVDPETTDAVHGVVLLRDWLSDADAFDSFSHFVDRPPLCASVDEAAAWYVQMKVFSSRAAATTVVTSLLQPCPGRAGMEWVTAAATLPVSQLISDSVAALKSASATVSVPSMVLLFGDASDSANGLAVTNTQIESVRVSMLSPPYYPSVDAPGEVVRAVRTFVNQVNRDEEEDNNKILPHHFRMMLPSPGP